MRTPMRLAAVARNSTRRSNYSRILLSRSFISSNSPRPALSNTPVPPVFFSSTPSFSSMSSQSLKNPETLRDHLTPANLKALRNFWFEHLDDQNDCILFKPEQGRRWFFGGKEFDDACIYQFKPILEAIRSTQVASAKDILAIAQPQSPLDWLSLVLLLDQIPRNCYRGAEASICFRFFDPLAVQVAEAAFDLGIPDVEPSTRWQFAYRIWFYMPLMHSETLPEHNLAVKKFGELERDVLGLLDAADDAASDEYQKRARKAVQRDPETAKNMACVNMEFEKKHLIIIERFGRYPHRNKVMGREPTAEETEYLENGGDTFGS